VTTIPILIWLWRNSYTVIILLQKCKDNLCVFTNFCLHRDPRSSGHWTIRVHIISALAYGEERTSTSSRFSSLSVTHTRTSTIYLIFNFETEGNKRRGEYCWPRTLKIIHPCTYYFTKFFPHHLSSKKALVRKVYE